MATGEFDGAGCVARGVGGVVVSAVPVFELEHALRSATDPTAAIHNAVRCMFTPDWPEFGSLMLSLQPHPWLVKCPISIQCQ